MRWAVCYLLAFCGGLLIGTFACRERSGPAEVVTRYDTVRIATPELVVVHTRDTIVARLPVAAPAVHGVDTVLLCDSIPVRDTLRVRDSVEVLVPIEQREYADSNYRAWVSGYRPRLDSLVLIKRNAPLLPVKAERRISVGVQAGIGLTPKGVQPYVGLGVNFKLW